MKTANVLRGIGLEWRVRPNQWMYEDVRTCRLNVAGFQGSSVHANAVLIRVCTVQGIALVLCHMPSELVCFVSSFVEYVWYAQPLQIEYSAELVYLINRAAITVYLMDELCSVCQHQPHCQAFPFPVMEDPMPVLRLRAVSLLRA